MPFRRETKKMKNTKLQKKEEMDLQETQARVEQMQAMVNETKVENDQDLTAVGDKIKSIKEIAKFVKEEKEKYTKPAQAIINEARAKYVPYEKLCQEAETGLKMKVNQYMTKKEEERRKKEEAIAKRAEKGTLKEETAVRKMEELGEEKKSVSTDNAQIQRRKVKEVVIVDTTKIPQEYWKIDEVKIRKVALSGIEIPGVEVKETSQIAIK